ncbi:MAG: hypothetical protein JO362_24020 [Streptomycetaceae bacterium]|nr:hypothetical protein [Streptomycetaceae bacterium]
MKSWPTRWAWDMPASAVLTQDCAGGVPRWPPEPAGRDGDDGVEVAEWICPLPQPANTVTSPRATAVALNRIAPDRVAPGLWSDEKGFGAHMGIATSFVNRR